nr:WbqC family protein [uncultured Roseobacter sp.]
MQPYFLPYLGYFQLIAASDIFVVYDTIQHTKKGWINRNQMLRNGEAVIFSIPLKKDSDFLHVADRYLSDAFEPQKLCNQIEGAYRKAPHFSQTMPLIETIVHFQTENLFEFIYHSICHCCEHLGITTALRISSDVENGVSDLRNADRVIDICKRVGATEYINPPGGRNLYAAGDFNAQGLKLRFLQPHLPTYAQFGRPFVPSLSILDVMMFNSIDQISTTFLKEYDLVD